MTNNVKVGILTVLGVIVLLLVLTWKTVSVVEVQGNTLIGDFTDIAGLMESAEVKYRGFKVGKVVKIEPRAHDILVHMKVDKSLKVPKDSVFVIGFDGLIGAKYIAISPGRSDELCVSGETLHGKSSAGMVEFIDKGAAALDEAQRLLASVRMITEDPLIHKSIQESLKSFMKLSQELEKTGPKIDNIVKNVDSIVAQLKPIFEDGQFSEKTKSLIANIEQASNDLKDMTKSVRKITDDPDTEKNVREIIENLRDISEELKGSFGTEDVKKSSSKESLKDALKLAKTFSSFRAGVDADLLYSGYFQRPTVRAGAQIAFNPNQYYEVRAGEISAGQGAVLDIVQGNKLNKDLAWRWGVIQTGVGIGAEYTMWDTFSIMADVYGPDQLKSSVGTKWQFNKNWAFLSRAERMGERDGNYYVGVNVRP